MKNRICSILVLVMFYTMTARADNHANLLRADHPQEHVVVKGDTLWHIAERFLKSPWKWPEVWSTNPQVDNPHLIFPGDVIFLTWANGKPQFNLRRDSRIYPKERYSSLDKAIPAIPLKDIVGFLENNRILSEEVFNSAPYILGGNNQRIIAGAGDRVYARGKLLSEQTRQGVYRIGNRYQDPETKEFLGFEVMTIAEGNVVTQGENDIISFDLIKSRKEARVTDRLVPTEKNQIPSILYPRAAPANTTGIILAILGGVRDGGQFNIVAINKGTREGLKPGYVLATFREGGSVKDPVTNKMIELPAERSGEALIFKVYEKISYGLILHSSNVVSVGDQVREP